MSPDVVTQSHEKPIGIKPHQLFLYGDLVCRICLPYKILNTFRKPLIFLQVFKCERFHTVPSRLNINKILYTTISRSSRRTLYRGLDTTGVCLLFVTTAAWVWFPASTCGRVVVAYPRSEVFSGFSGRPQNANISAFKNTSISLVEFSV